MEKSFLSAISDAIINLIHIHSYFPLTGLEPPVSPEIIETGSDTFILGLFDNESPCGTFDITEANKVMKSMINIVTQELRSRNLEVELTGRVVQKFDWDGKNIDLTDCNVNYVVLLDGKVIKHIGSDVCQNVNKIVDASMDKLIEAMRTGYFV